VGGGNVFISGSSEVERSYRAKLSGIISEKYAGNVREIPIALDYFQETYETFISLRIISANLRNLHYILS
jgi:hypothetical protein